MHMNNCKYHIASKFSIKIQQFDEFWVCESLNIIYIILLLNITVYIRMFTI